jgi:hypothetical protein
LASELLAELLFVMVVSRSCTSTSRRTDSSPGASASQRTNRCAANRACANALGRLMMFVLLDRTRGRLNCNRRRRDKRYAHNGR